MPDFDVAAFVTRLDRMGMKLTAVPLADGKLRINRWRMLNACEHAQQIQDLWTTQIGSDQARIDVLGAHLVEAGPRAAGYSTIPSQMRLSSQSIAVPDAASEHHVAPDQRGAVTLQFGTTAPGPSAVQPPTSVPSMASSRPPTAPQRVERTAGASSPIGIQATPGAQRPQGPQPGPARPAVTQTAAAPPIPGGSPIATGQPTRTGPRGTSDTSRPESANAAFERLTSANPRGAGPRSAVSPQRVTATPLPGGSQNAR